MSASRRNKHSFGTRFTIARFARLAKALRTGEKFFATTIAAEFEVNPKTIRRDMNYLRDRLGYDFEFRQRENTWRLLSAPEAVL